MAAPVASGYWQAVGLRALAAFLILWTPFFVFSAYRGHPLPPLTLAGSALVAALLALALAALCGRRGKLLQTILFTCLAALALDVQFDWFEKAAAYAVALGLFGLFWLLRRHLSTILATAFAALLVSTALTAQPRRGDETATAAPAADVAGESEGQRRIVHLILDEHAGIEGIPEGLPGGPALRAELVEFFASNGFRVFGNAISEYATSRDSISGILNFTAGAWPYERYRGREPYVLTQNAYFDALAADGYRIAVNQSTYLDYCSEQRKAVDRCHTYAHDSTRWLADAALDNGEKLKVFFGLYLQLSDIAKSLFKAYARLQRSQRGGPLELPALPEWDAGPSSMNAMLAFDRFIQEVDSGGGNRLYFAHLLLPHGPYAFDAACRLRRDSSTWANHRPPFLKDSSETQRARSYRYYFEQVRCVKTRLQAMFDRLRVMRAYGDAIIIVHGDHGSRIAQVAPRAGNLKRLAAQDFRDAFSTLFAVKAPGFEPGYDATLAPVSRLLAQAIGRPDLSRGPAGQATVYLEGDDDEPRTPVPWTYSD